MEPTNPEKIYEAVVSLSGFTDIMMAMLYGRIQNKFRIGGSPCLSRRF